MSSWKPESQIIEDWGRLQVVINGVDLTFYRDKPTEVLSWEDLEPFSDASARLRFPGISSFQRLGDMPFKKFDEVLIQKVHPVTNQVVRNVFEGMVVSHDDTMEDISNGLVIDCLGSLYQADFYIKPPIINDYTFDLATAIKLELDERIENYGLRVKPLPEHTYANIGSRNRGSFNPLLTGWIQELLGSAYTQSFMIDSEEAVAIAYHEQQGNFWLPTGYMIGGQYGSYLSFGNQFPNWGSWSYLTLFLMLFDNKPRLAVSDIAVMPDVTGMYSVSLQGEVAFHGDTNFGIPMQTLGDVKGNAHDVVSINMTPSGNGYWLLDTTGRVFTFGDAQHFGNGPSLPTWFGRTDNYVDMSPTPSGNGYYLLSKYGKVHFFGDGTDFGGLQNAVITEFDVETVRIVSSGIGYYVLFSDGRVSEFGAPSVPHLGDLRGSKGSRFVDMAVNSAGDGYGLLQADGFFRAFGNFAFRGHGRWSNTIGAGGNIYQWTLMKHPGKQVDMKIKNTWTTHWTAHVGTPGFQHTLYRDYTQVSNTFYGEGVDGENCSWRNTKYPNIHPDDSPVWPGYLISTTQNSQTAGVAVWQQGMIDRGWGWIVKPDGVFSAADRSATLQLQANAGIQVDGIVGPQTWTATFAVGENAGSNEGAYYAPLAVKPEVEPFLFDGTGAITGKNPKWDKNEVRIETYENYGEGMEKVDAIISSRARLKRAEQNPGYYGTITLKSDPEEGSRFDIRAGENLVYKGYRGWDVRFHVSGVSTDMESGTVTLTVDNKNRDYLTIANLIQRNRETNEVGGIRTRRASMAMATEDRIAVWDCASGAGQIPRHGIYSGLWNVIRVPMGGFGEVIQTDIRVDNPSPFAAAIFDRPVTANFLASLGEPSDSDFWKNFPENRGLIISWGGENNMAGYYPGRQSDQDPVTGVLIDRASWVYWTSEPPWVWVALWCPVTNFIRGRMYPGTEGVSTVPDVVTLPGAS
jgi:peptidoglycan hydrolase-like protein with peptidoglycan-binding domain